jgi:LPXTG-motif cell wall-anchored protein
MFGVGEFTFENGARQLFGTQTTFIVWGSPSMTYSWVLLLPLIAVAADRVGAARESAVPRLGPGAWPLLAALLVGSTGAKATSVPVVLGALLFTGLILLALRRRQAWPVLAAAAVALAAQASATAVLFAFENHAVTFDPLYGLSRYLAKPEDGPAPNGWIVAGVVLAFVLSLHLRWAGILALLWHRRGRPEPVQLFLLGGALAGPTIYLLVAHPGNSNQYFLRSAFAFGVIGSAWGYVLVLERARLGWPGRIALGGFATLLVAVLVAVQLRLGTLILAPQLQTGWFRAELAPYAPLLPLLRWAGVLAAVALVVGVAWAVLGRILPLARWVARRPPSKRRPLLRGRGAAFLLTGVLVAGAPGLVMDAAAARHFPNGGAYGVVVIPQSRVEAARWVREHSAPTDVLATNAHCLAWVYGVCDARSFWLSAYSERSVLVEGWSFAPRAIGVYPPFWDQALLRLNDEAFVAPSTSTLSTLALRYRVRWLVVDRTAGTEASTLRRFADLRYENDRIAVYRLR